MVLSPVAGRRRALLVAGAVLALVLVVLAVLLTRPDAPPAASPTATPTPTASPGAPDPSTPAAPPAPTTGPPATSPPAPEPTAEPVPEVPAPVTGSIDDLAAAVPSLEGGTTLGDPVEEGEIAQVAPGVTVSLTAVERVNPQASGPGEVARPALALTVTVTNGGTGTLTLDGVVVNLYGQAGTPGSTYSSDPRSRPLTGELAPGAQESGTYVMSLPSSIDGELVMSVSLGPDVPTSVVVVTVPEES